VQGDADEDSSHGSLADRPGPAALRSSPCRAQLKRDPLARVTRAPHQQTLAMTDGSHFAPQGWHTVTPRIVVHDAKQLVEFLKYVFGATGEYRPAAPSEVRIGDSLVTISDAGIRSPMTAFLYVYVNDTDATYQRALDAGARSVEEPADMPYGDRRCLVEDTWGNSWQIATRAGRREVQGIRHDAHG